LWFTAAEEIVRGKALYREVHFDKPPGLALVYAFLFWIFGPHSHHYRLFTIAYSLAISAVLYLFGSRLYDKRVGLLAAGLFAVFSTTYTTGHVQGLGTDFLMALPYTAGAYMLVRATHERTYQAWLATAGGVLTGVALQVNPKAIFDLIFLAALLTCGNDGGRGTRTSFRIRGRRANRRPVELLLFAVEPQERQPAHCLSLRTLAQLNHYESTGFMSGTGALATAVTIRSRRCLLEG
jgi:hypothetical protein